MKVLVVEDNPDVVEALILCFKLRWPEASVISTSLGIGAASLVKTESPDVIILDLGLPDVSGFKVLQEVRSFSPVPILILTVRNDEESKIKGLDLGADDYMVKPFTHTELMARVRAIIQRSRK